jgi:hypothetical protein
MAEQTNNQQPKTANTFTGGMVKDAIDMLKQSNSYTHGRNITTNLSDGQLGGRSSEPATIASALVPYTMIGCLYMAENQWMVFSTNNTVSEIGIFLDINDTYSTLVNDAATIAAGRPGFNFNTNNLITGVVRRGFDCGFDGYWADGRRNPDRMLNTTFLNPNPWVQSCTTSAGCTTCINTNILDAEQLRLAPLITIPCLKLSKHRGSGQLPNGSYQVCVAYSINGIKCTDYLAFSDVIGLWTHLVDGSAFDIKIENIDNATKIRFTEMEVVVVSMVNQQVEAKKLGTYSTNQGVITVSVIDKTLPNIPIAQLPISTPAIVSSDAIYSLSNYLTRVGPTERPDFNYQLLANSIVTKWVAVQYNEDYYQKGGNEYGMNVGYLRGEVYAVFIRFIYNTGDKSASYVIPGRAAGNTATIQLSGLPSIPGGTVLCGGLMEGWQSTERYPDNQIGVWGPLCGQQIRWHKFPDQSTFPGTTLSHFNPQGPQPAGKGYISVLGMFFENIQPPLDNNGNIIPDIVGYEILRATRDGHESILAKGMINNMRTYVDGTGKTGLFQNYPYNDLRPDYFLTSNVNNINVGTVGNGARDPLVGYRNDVLSFHSPDTVFRHPFLGTGSLELTMAMSGNSTGMFTQPYKHPMFKVLTDFVSILTGTLSVLATLINTVNFINMTVGGNAPDIKLASTDDVPISFPLFSSNNYTLDVAGTDTSIATKILANTTNLAMLLLLAPIQVATIQEQLLTVIKGLVPGRQYAAQYNSFGFYGTPQPVQRANFNISNYEYIGDKMQSFNGFTVNNLYRNDYVALQLESSIVPRTFDNSRYNIGPTTTPAFNIWDSTHTIDSYYGTYRVAQPSQYGQIDSVKQVAIACVQQMGTGTTVIQTPIMFGGDTYINRYTEKNPFFFFNDWLRNSESDPIYDYRNYINVPYPMFWINNDVVTYDLLTLVSKNRRLDGPLNLFTGWGSLFFVKQGFFYLFNNGVRDFFVESSVNVGYRDWEDETSKRFYDPYGSSVDFVNEMFRSDIIKSNILYKYDYSLSVNRFINQYISWSQCLRRDYDPELAYSCFAYYPRRVAYSLPQEEELMQDNWKIFLPNNYINLPSKVAVIKDLHKTGGIFLMENDSPLMFTGVETMPSKSGTEYTVGTGLLFEQTLQSITNTDGSYEYAHCQGKRAVVNTPHGLYWVAQNTGKLFHFGAGKLTDIGQEAGLKYHLLEYLPSKLLKQFPNYDLYDNPVTGIGTQLIYDSILDILYITRKECTLKKQYEGVVLYDPEFGFYTTDGVYRCTAGYTLVGRTCVKTTDPIDIGIPSTLSPVTNAAWGNRGPAIFDPGYSVGGIGTHTLIPSPSGFWPARVNAIAVWDVVNDPIDVWVGFKQCITVTTTKTYYVAVCADNDILIQLDGVTILEISSAIDNVAFTSQFVPPLTFIAPGSGVFQLMGIYPITISAGTHVLQVSGRNSAGPGMLAMEIYDATAAAIIAATNTTPLNIVFTTQGKTTFNNTVYACPAGYTTIAGATPCDLPVCRTVKPAVLNRTPVVPCDPLYFEDASWTLSYDCAAKTFIGWHDWHPALHVPSKNHFYTTQGLSGQLWKHNTAHQLFCNYYGIDYPMEIEYFTNTQITDTILQNVEWLLESYQFAPNGVDKFMNFDESWDYMMIYNQEQNSGMQVLTLKPWDNPYAALNYPFFDTFGNRNILYNKVENKYRVNSFYDFTKDRGQFTLTNTPMFTTNPNGYTSVINGAYLDITKSPFQQKRFRYTGTRIFMRKTGLGKNAVVIRYASTNNIISPR